MIKILTRHGRLHNLLYQNAAEFTDQSQIFYQLNVDGQDAASKELAQMDDNR